MHPLPGVFLECQYILFLSQLENLVLNWTKRGTTVCWHPNPAPPIGWPQRLRMLHQNMSDWQNLNQNIKNESTPLSIVVNSALPTPPTPTSHKKKKSALRQPINTCWSQITKVMHSVTDEWHLEWWRLSGKKKIQSTGKQQKRR